MPQILTPLVVSRTWEPSRGEVVSPPERGSEPAKVRPAVVVQAEWLLESTINTVLVVPLSSNTALDAFPGNVLVPAEASGLDRDSVANVTQVGPVSREFLDPHPAGAVPSYLLGEIAAGIRLVTGI